MMYVLISERGNRYVIEGTGRYVFEEGVVEVREEHLLRFPQRIQSSKNVVFVLDKITFKDLFEKRFRRGAQIIHEKDLGYIMRRFYLGKDAIMLEAGTGSGHATLYLSQMFKHLICYEKDKRFYEITQHNLKLFEVDNVSLHNEDVEKCSLREEVDFVLFDFKNAYEEVYVDVAYRALKPGKWLVMYFPVMEQVMKAIDNLKRRNFVNISVKEVLLREWKTSPLRPQTKMLSHTAFILESQKTI